MFSDSNILTELKNTIFFVIVSVPITIASALILANALNTRKLPGKGIFRTVFFVPYVILPVITAQIFLILFNTRFGMVNGFLAFLGFPGVSWFADATLTRLIIVLVTLWANVGYYTIVILAGLQNISIQYYEACDIDGGSAWTKFIHITIPLVTPQLFFCFILSTIVSFKMFDYIFVFGKNNVLVLENIRTLAYGIYERSFTFLDMGYASAQAIVLTVIVLSITILQNIFQKRWVHYT
jgi:multiple sugar transport system permease protein